MTWYETVVAHVTKVKSDSWNQMVTYIRGHAADHKSGGIQPIKLDELAAPGDSTTLDATTTLHGLLLKAVAPAAGLLSIVGIGNGETSYALKPLFDTTNPEMNGTAAPGSQVIAARRDHVHASDTSRAPVNSPTFTGTPAAPTAPDGTRTTQIASTEFVQNAIGSLPVIVTGRVTNVEDGVPMAYSPGGIPKRLLLQPVASGSDLYMTFMQFVSLESFNGTEFIANIKTNTGSSGNPMTIDWIAVM